MWVQFDYIGVIQGIVNSKLLYKLFNHIVLKDSWLEYFLDGAEKTGLFVLTDEDITKFAWADALTQLEMIYFEAFLIWWFLLFGPGLKDVEGWIGVGFSWFLFDLKVNLVVIVNWEGAGELEFISVLGRFGFVMGYLQGDILVLFVSAIFLTFCSLFHAYLNWFRKSVRLGFIKCKGEFFFYFFNFREEDVDSWRDRAHCFFIWLSYLGLVKGGLLAVDFSEVGEVFEEGGGLYDVEGG